MKEIFVYSLLSGFFFLGFIVFLILRFTKKKKIYLTLSIVGLIISTGLGIAAIYITANKTYTKVVHETDDLLVKGTNKAGEVVGEASVSFAEGAEDGVENVFKNDTKITDELKSKSVDFGNIVVEAPNELSVYLIFNADYSGNISVKVLNEDGIETGRATQEIDAPKGQADYYTFQFSEKTKIGEQSTFLIE